MMIVTETIELTPSSEEARRTLMEMLSSIPGLIPALTAGVTLERITLTLKRKRHLGTVEVAPAPVVLGHWAEKEIIDADYSRLTLQELGIDRDCRPSDMAGRLTLVHPGSTGPCSLRLTLKRYLCLLALATKTLRLDRESVSRYGKEALLFRGTELSDGVSTLGEAQGLPPDSVLLTEKEIGDYFGLINGALSTRNLPKLVLGTPKKGFRLSVPPGDISFIPAP